MQVWICDLAQTMLLCVAFELIRVKASCYLRVYDLLFHTDICWRLRIAPAVVDSGYDGEVFVNLHNIGKHWQTIEPGDKIAQAVVVPVVHARFVASDDPNIYDWHPITISNRGDGALGSTGK
jgi:hypothetical protein